MQINFINTRNQSRNKLLIILPRGQKPRVILILTTINNYLENNTCMSLCSYVTHITEKFTTAIFKKHV